MKAFTLNKVFSQFLILALILPALSPILMDNQHEVTIHKIWKLKNTKFIRATAIGLRGFEILNLVNKDTLTNNDLRNNDKISSTAYHINNDTIFLEHENKDNYYLLKISDLKENELTLIIHAIYKNKDGLKLEADLLELNYEPQNP